MKDQRIDTLRGLACLLLVVYHVIGATPSQGLRVEEGWLRHLTDVLMTARMPVFGFLAGAMLGLGSKAGLALVQDKALRLLVPMLTVGSLFAVLQNITPGSNQPVANLYLLHIVPVAHYWFLESLFILVLLLVLAEQWRPIRDLRAWSLYFALSLACYLAQPGIIWFSLLGAAYLAPYFLLGLAFTRLDWDRHQLRRGAGQVCVAAGLAVTGLLLWSGQVTERFTPGALAAGLLVAGGLWSLGLSHPALAWVGRYSYPIFLFHVFFSAATRRTLHSLGLDDLSLHILVGGLTAVLGSVALADLVDKNAYARWLLLGEGRRRPLQRVAA